MIRIRIIFLVALFVFLASCEKGSHINLGFDSTIKKFSDGMIIADIKGSYEKVYIHGIIRLSEREILVNFLKANGIVVYTKTFKVPVDFRIIETFFAGSGYWKLSYKSNQGA